MQAGGECPGDEQEKRREKACLEKSAVDSQCGCGEGRGGAEPTWEHAGAEGEDRRRCTEGREWIEGNHGRAVVEGVEELVQGGAVGDVRPVECEGRGHAD